MAKPTVANTTLWTIRPKSKPDELLSSWLVRLADCNGLKLQTFCNMMCGRDRAIWNRDIDKLADPGLLAILAKGSGAGPERSFQTTLPAYKNTLYSDHNAYGNTQWIHPLGVYHRLRRGYGVQFCPKCDARERDKGQVNEVNRCGKVRRLKGIVGRPGDRAGAEEVKRKTDRKP